jgi:hypothetical protein
MHVGVTSRADAFELAVAPTAADIRLIRRTSRRAFARLFLRDAVATSRDHCRLDATRRPACDPAAPSARRAAPPPDRRARYQRSVSGKTHRSAAVITT